MRNIFIILIGLFLIGCDSATNERIPLLWLGSSNSDLDINHVKIYSGTGPKILFMGDSRIDLYDIPQYYPGKNIINYGKSGSSTIGIVLRTNNAIAMNPEIVIISVGINDVRRGHTLNLIVNNLTNSIRKIQATNPDVRVYVTNIVPCTNNLSNFTVNDRVREISPFIKSMCVTLGVTYIYLDCLESGGVLNPALTIDGTHYNAAGYDILTQFYKAHILELN